MQFGVGFYVAILTAHTFAQCIDAYARYGVQ